jgi:hypothetical protein
LFSRFLDIDGITSISSHNVSFLILFSHATWRPTPISPSFIEESINNQYIDCYELCVCGKGNKNKEFSAAVIIWTFLMHRFVAQQICYYCYFILFYFKEQPVI